MKLDTRIWAVISFVLVGAILAGGWFLGAAPFLEAKATAEEQRTAIEAQNAQHEATLIALQEASERLPELQARAIELEKAIPSDLESSPLINAINNLAASSGVTIKSITIEEALAYQAPVDHRPQASFDCTMW